MATESPTTAPPRPRHFAMAAIFAALALALVEPAVAAVVPTQLGPAKPADGAHAAASRTIRVVEGEFFIRLSKRSISRPGTVTFSVRNSGHVQHDFTIGGKKTPVFSAGKTKRLVVTFHTGE